MTTPTTTTVATQRRPNIPPSARCRSAVVTANLRTSEFSASATKFGNHAVPPLEAHTTTPAPPRVVPHHCPTGPNHASRLRARPLAAFLLLETLVPDNSALKMQREAGSPFHSPRHRPVIAPTTVRTVLHRRRTRPDHASRLGARPIATFLRLETPVSDNPTHRMQQEAGSPSRSPRCRPTSAPTILETSPHHRHAQLYSANRLRTITHMTNRPIATFSHLKTPVSDNPTRRMQQEAGSPRRAPRLRRGGVVGRALITVTHVRMIARSLLTEVCDRAGAEVGDAGGRHPEVTLRSSKLGCQRVGMRWQSPRAPRSDGVQRNDFVQKGR